MYRRSLEWLRAYTKPNIVRDFILTMAHRSVSLWHGNSKTFALKFIRSVRMYTIAGPTAHIDRILVGWIHFLPDFSSSTAMWLCTCTIPFTYIRLFGYQRNRSLLCILASSHLFEMITFIVSIWSDFSLWRAVLVHACRLRVRLNAWRIVWLLNCSVRSMLGAACRCRQILIYKSTATS